jgi:hypothetical protein
MKCGVRFDALTVVTMKNIECWGVMEFIFLKVFQRFGGTCLGGIRSRNQQEAGDKELSLLALTTYWFLERLARRL